MKSWRYGWGTGRQLLLFAFCGLLVGSVTTSRADEPPPPPWVTATAEELAEAKGRLDENAAAELLDYQVTIDDRSVGSAISEKRNQVTYLRIKVYDPDRAASVTRISRFWRTKMAISYRFKARVTSPNGSVRLFTEKDFQKRILAKVNRANGFFGSIRGDLGERYEERFLALPGLEPRAVVELWEWDPGFERPSLSVHTFNEADQFPVRHLSFAHLQAKDDKVAEMNFVLNPGEGKGRFDEKKNGFFFETTNLLRYPEETLPAPRSYKQLAIVQASSEKDQYLSRNSGKIPLPSNTPASLGPWATTSTVDAYTDEDMGYPTKDIKKKAAALVEGIASERGKAEAIYRYMRDLYQRSKREVTWDGVYYSYVAVPEELIDLKDIESRIPKFSTFYYLYIGLLKAAGLEARTVRHGDRKEFPFSVDLVSSRIIWNKTIAIKVNGEWILTDPLTYSPQPFGELSWRFEGQPALIAYSQAQNFLEVPPLPPTRSARETELELTLNADGALRGRGRQTLTGHEARELRSSLRDTPKETWAREAKAWLGVTDNWAEVEIERVENIEDPDQTLAVEFKLFRPEAWIVSEGRFSLPPTVMLRGKRQPLQELIRKTPAFLSYGSYDREAVKITLPEGFSVRAIPKPVAASDKDHGFGQQVRFDPATRTLEIQRESFFRPILIPADAVKPHREWLQKVSIWDRTVIDLIAAAAPVSR